MLNNGRYLLRVASTPGCDAHARQAKRNKPRRERRVNAYEQLEAIIDRLEQNGASEDSIELVERFLKRAEPERNSSTSISQVMMLRHLLRQKDTADNYNIYNDLQELMSEIEARRASDDDVRPAYEEEHKPRPKSYYKAQREREGK
jgi:hypothetical protein